MAGLKVVVVKCDELGDIDIDDLELPEEDEIDKETKSKKDEESEGDS